MKKLVPVLTGKEEDSNFIEKIKEDCEEIILLYVVERDDVEEVPAGFAGSRIKDGEETMEQIEEKLSSSIDTEKNIEWGNPAEKVKASAVVKNVDRVTLKKSKASARIEKALKGRDVEIRTI